MANRFSPTVKPYEGPTGIGNLAHALLSGIESYRGTQDRYRAEEDRQLGRTIKKDTHKAYMRDAELDAAERGYRDDSAPSAPQAPRGLADAFAGPEPEADETAMPGTGLAGAMAGTPAGVPKSPTPGGFNPFTLQFDVPPVNPLESVALPSGGRLDPNVPIQRAAAEAKAKGLAGNEVAAAGRGDVARELEPALATVPGAPAGAARSPAAAADWLGRPPQERALRLGDEGYVDAVAEAARARAAAIAGGRPPTEIESKDYVFAGLMRNSMPDIRATENEVRPEIITALRIDPTGATRIAQTDAERVFIRAVREFTAAALRKESGAAITGEEVSDMLDRYVDTGFDGPPGSPVRAAKARARENYMALLEHTSMRARQYYERIGSTPGASAPPAVPPTQTGLSDLSPRSRRP